MPFLRVQNGGHAGSVFTVGRDPVRIGRDKGLEIQLIDQGVSRRHAEVIQIGEMHFVRDTGSRNGTFVNEEQVDQELLRPGDEVRIGSTVLVFQDEAADQSSGEHATDFESLAEQTMTVDLRNVEDDDVVDPPVEAPAATRARDALIRLAEVAAEERDKKGLLRAVVDIAAHAVDAECAYIFVRRGGAREFSLDARHGPVTKGEPAISRGIIRRVVEDGTPVLTSDAFSDERFQGSQSVIARGIESVICAPLRAQGELVGVIYLAQAKGGKEFDEGDLELITAVGIQAGVALQGIELARRRERTLVDAVRVLVRILEVKDPLAAGHTERVAAYADATARTLGLSPSERRRLRLAAYLHNVGRLSLGQQAKAEIEFDRKQVEHTLDLVGRMQGMEEVLPIIRYAYERMDGSGMQGVAGERIPFAARILAVANAVDAAATIGGEGAKPLPIKDALSLVAGQSGRFDRKVVEAFETVVAYGAVKSDRLAVDEEEDS